MAGEGQPRDPAAVLKTMANSKDNRELNSAISKAMREATFPDLRAILCEFMRVAGGAKGIARMLKREYKSAEPGSQLRANILQMILSGAKAITSKETSKDTSLISDADLDRETGELMARVAASGKYGPAEGTNEPS